MVDPEEMISQFNRFASDKLIERIKEVLSEKDPTLDWTTIRVIANFNENRFYFESKDPQIEERLRRVYEKLNEARPDKPAITH